MNFRAAAGRRIDWLDTRIESGFSNFLFIDRRYRSHSVLRRIFSLARLHHFTSLLIEDISETDCALLVEENAALRIRRGTYQHSVTHRLSFWRCPPDQPSSTDDFIGYAIFKSDDFAGVPPKDHIFEAVMPQLRTASTNNFIHCSRAYTIETLAGQRSAHGVLYAQQNDLTFVCAHVALRTALSCLLPEGDISYSRMNELIGVDHQTHIVGEGGGGLSPVQMETILTGLGVSHEKIVHEPSMSLDLPSEFQRDLYGFIESGCPALLGFELDDPATGPHPRHIVPVIGHTFNDDAWVPDAQRHYFGNQLRYYSSESWLSSYVLHDDNFGPYFCLPRHFLKKDNFRIILGMHRQSTAFSASDAEAVGFDFLRAIAQRPLLGQDWYDRFVIYARQGLLVLRCLLVDRRDYVAHLREIRSWEGDAMEPANVTRLEACLPERFWLIEASAQELFTASRRKFGEVLLSCSTPLPHPLDLSVLLAARLPGTLLINQPAGLETAPTQLQGHTFIFSAKPSS